MNTIQIKEGREKPFRHKHPWVFSSAIARPDPKIGPGEMVDVVDYLGKFLARGYYNFRSQISLRLLEWDQNKVIDEAWWYEKLSAAVSRRTELLNRGTTNSARLVYGEADLIPGLIADQYGGFIVLQSLTAGIEKVKDTIAGILYEICSPRGIYEKSDADVRKLEGLSESSGLLKGTLPEDRIAVFENGVTYIINMREGQKTGFFLDQRNNRRAVSAYASGREVLDAFCYTGGFTLQALKAGAKSVVSVDSSGPALDALKANFEANKMDYRPDQLIEGDAFEVLRKFRDDGRKFDMIVLDPPKLAPTKAHVQKALRAYKDINLQALKILRPGGILATFSCSGGISREDFKMAVAWAGVDSGRQVQVIENLSQAEDHPILLSYPESEYLKGFICRVI